MRSALLVQQLIPQLAFLAPDRLLILLIIPALILAYIFASLRKNRRGMRFTNTSMLDVVVPKQSQWRRHLAVALVATELDHPHCGVRPAQDSGRCAAGARHSCFGDRRIAVDAGDGSSRPDLTRPSSGDRLRRRSAREIQRLGGLDGRCFRGLGSADDCAQHRGERDQQHSTAGLHGHR